MYWTRDALWVIVAFDVNNIAIQRKVVRKNVHTTIPKNNMEYDTVAVEPTFFCLPLALAKIPSLPIKPFFQISLKKNVLKTIHNKFWWLPRSLFPRTFLEVTACTHGWLNGRNFNSLSLTWRAVNILMALVIFVSSSLSLSPIFCHNNRWKVRGKGPNGRSFSRFP